MTMMIFRRQNYHSLPHRNLFFVSLLASVAAAFADFSVVTMLVAAATTARLRVPLVAAFINNNANVAHTNFNNQSAFHHFASRSSSSSSSSCSRLFARRPLCLRPHASALSTTTSRPTTTTTLQFMSQTEENDTKENDQKTYHGSDAVRSQHPTETSSKTLQMFSFYHFESLLSTGSGDDKQRQPDRIRDDLFDALKSSIPGLRGTIYVAPEGINAQLAVPPEYLDLFVDTIRSVLPFDPFQHSSDKGPNLGDVVSISTPTFKRLIVRTRDFILRDGISENTDGKDGNSSIDFDWNDSGPELSPQQWHEELTQATSKTSASTSNSNDDESNDDDDSNNVLILDCRNNYESDEGIFDGAIPLDTTTFQESWTRLDELTKEKDRDKPVYIYCTGGIRCVKTGAYLKQKLGFQDVRRLEKGIIGYEKWIEEHPDKKEESVWKGKNFLFDKRRFQEGKEEEEQQQ